MIRIKIINQTQKMLVFLLSDPNVTRMNSRKIFHPKTKNFSRKFISPNYPPAHSTLALIISPQEERKNSVYFKTERNQGHETNSIPETILTFISLKTSTHFHLRNVDIDIASGVFSAGLKEWENLTMLNAVTHNYI